MKLNFINKAYIALSVILLGLIIFKIWTYKASERFHYYSSVSAPANFPVHINGIGFILPADDLDLGFYKTAGEEVNVFLTEWGKQYYFPEVHEPLRLPLKLTIDYCDYRGQKFYQDTIDLPKKELLAVFKQAVKDKKTTEMYNARQDQQGLNFVVGIANNGYIVLWLRGSDFEKTIFKKKLRTYEPNAKDLIYNQHQFDKKGYLDTVFAELPDSMKTLFKNGYDAGANYIDTPSRYLELK